MDKTPEISVVIPLFNEEQNVELLQKELAAGLAGLDAEIILVDDCSTDGTRERIAKTKGTRVIKLEKNSGQSAAMLVGIQAALAPWIAMLDGDLQNDPADIPSLLELARAEDWDLVCGYRATRKDTWFKRVQSRIANHVRSRFTGDGVRDTGCTLKVMRRETREALLPFTGMHRFIPALIKGSGYRITECPVSHRPRHAGTSKYGFGNRAFRATADMFAVKWLLSRRFFVKSTEVDAPRSDSSPHNS